MELNQSSKLLVILALMLVLGALLLPVSAYAHTDMTPDDETLTIGDVKLSGDMLSFTVTDKESGLIQEVEVNILDYYDLFSEYITIEVQNHDGKKTQAFQIRNPYYVPGQQPPSDNEIDDLPDYTNPFTPDGTGTVVDNADSSEGKEFFTVETPDGNIFYLVIDRHRTAENVYLLNAVTEQDLLSLAEIDEVPERNSPVIPIEPVEPEPVVPDEPESEDPEKSGNGTMIFIIIAVITVGIAGYYFKIVRPKQNADIYDDDDDEDDEEEINDDENEIELDDEDE